MNYLKVLEKPKRNLAYLLESYFKISIDKRLQQSDWRKRPLTAEQLAYARTDVQYLLKLMQILENELMAYKEIKTQRLNNKTSSISSLEDHSEKHVLLNRAWKKSHIVTANLYIKPKSHEMVEIAACQLVRRHLVIDSTDIDFNNDIYMRLFKLCSWRDKVARTGPNLKFKLQFQINYR